jgi:transketolase
MAELRSMRKAYGEALVELGAANPDVVVLDADVSASTQTWMFRERYPDRFFNVGVAEANMVDVAVGLALAGKIPFANTFAFLLALRAAEQIRTCVAYAKTNVKLVASYAGLSDAFDGPTHHAICDLAVVRSLPNMTVVVAADAVEVKKAVPAVAEYDGPVYLRVSRAEVPVIFDENHEVRIGQGVTLREGGDVTLIGTGIMVGRCLEAAEALRREGIDARVIEIHTLKPIDEGLIVQAAQETGAIITAEEHSIIGGLGGAVTEVLSSQCPVPILRVGIADTFAETGPYEALLERYGMGVTDITASVRRAVARKK